MRLFWDVEQLIKRNGEPPGYSVVFNGTPLKYALWVHEETGEAEILCQDYRSGELIPDSENVYGYQTQRIHGAVKVTCHRAKTGTDAQPLVIPDPDSLQMDFYQQLFSIP